MLGLAQRGISGLSASAQENNRKSARTQQGRDGSASNHRPSPRSLLFLVFPLPPPCALLLPLPLLLHCWLPLAAIAVPGGCSAARQGKAKLSRAAEEATREQKRRRGTRGCVDAHALVFPPSVSRANRRHWDRRSSRACPDQRRFERDTKGRRGKQRWAQQYAEQAADDGNGAEGMKRDRTIHARVLADCNEPSSALIPWPLCRQSQRRRGNNANTTGTGMRPQRIGAMVDTLRYWCSKTGTGESGPALER
jgi:hypothetical protein